MRTIYYSLSSLLWSLAPAPVDAPAQDFGSMSFDELISSMTSLLIILFALAVAIAGTVFIALRRVADKINPLEEQGLIRRFIRIYFDEYVLVGFLLCLIAFPVILYLLFNSALLVLAVIPAARHGLPKVAFPQAERIYFKGLTLAGSWLLLILLFPAAGLAVRALALRWRYTLENPFLRQMFIRSLKFSLICLLGWMGSISMLFLVDKILKLIFSLTV